MVGKIKERLKAYWAALLEIIGGFKEPGFKPKRMATLFFVSSAAAILITVALSQIFLGRYSNWRLKSNTSETAKNLTDLFGKEKEAAEVLQTRADLGRFLVELRPDPHLPRNSPTTMHLAELTVTVICDRRETCDLIESRMTEVHDQLSSVFVPMDRGYLLSYHGKVDLRNTIRDRLNRWLSTGKIEQVFFTHLTVG